MKRKLSLCLVLVLTLIMVFGSLNVSAYTSYDTYTYSIDGKPLMSPTAYETAINVSSEQMGLLDPKLGGKAISNYASDIVTDDKSNVYIADKGNNRIVILNKYYHAVAVIESYVDENGQAQTFKEPEGLFVTDPRIDSDGGSLWEA